MLAALTHPIPDSLHTAIDGALVLVLLLNLAMLATSRLATCIRLFSFQCLVISVLPIAAATASDAIGIHGFFLMGGTVVLKVFLIPFILLRVIRTGDIQREVQPYLGFTGSVVVGAMMIGGAFALSSRLVLPGQAMSTLLIPVAISTLLIGLLILVSRYKAITQVVGYLVLENGIYLFGLSLLHAMPLLVELGILLDVFVGVFVMAIVVYHIRQEFDHMDTQNLAPMKEPA